ncbi:MAG: prolyl oligopeptidase family serine peptidase [Chloroflexota bacterium]
MQHKPKHDMPFKLTYPATRTVAQVDDYHGTLVADPYRWLEDVDSAETQAWIAAQNELTESFLSRNPSRAKIRQRLTELWDFPKMSAPFKRGGRYFQFRNSGLQNQDVLCVLDALGGEARVLLDPNTLSDDGTIALNTFAVSDDGCWLAYATAASGSDWLTWRVRDVTTGADLPDVIEWSKFSGAAWLKDGTGFFYARYDAPAAGEAFAQTNYDQKLYFHRLGATQSDDMLIYERPDHKEWGFHAEVTDDGRYLVLHVSQGTDERNRVFYAEDPKGFVKRPRSEAERDQNPSGLKMIELIPDLEAAYQFVGNDGARFYFRTDLDAPRGRLIALDVTQPDKAHWQTLIAEQDDTLEQVTMAHDQFAAVYLHHAHHRLTLHERSGALARELALPTMGALVSVNGHRDDAELFYAFHSFVVPPTNYRYDFARGTNELLESPAVEFDASPYVTRQVFATSKDGTRVPMFLVHRRDLAHDGNNPTLLYGYGGFDIPVTPLFAVSRLVWLEMGGVLASANLRGGGEYGEAWHHGGMLQNKQNVFDDFIACAEHLSAERITSPQRLAIQGRSNGGLLVGAALTQRPDLFGAALPAVGVMDMLRFHKFTIGWAWVSDYGSADDPEQFKTLYAYSPLHNIKPGTRYPPTLVFTADHDDRVVPGHSFKFAAALQAAQGGEAPILIRIDAKAGHGLGKPTAMLIAEQADNWAFVAQVLGMIY